MGQNLSSTSFQGFTPHITQGTRIVTPPWQEYICSLTLVLLPLSKKSHNCQATCFRGHIIQLRRIIGSCTNAICIQLCHNVPGICRQSATEHKNYKSWSLKSKFCSVEKRCWPCRNVPDMCARQCPRATWLISTKPPEGASMLSSPSAQSSTRLWCGSQLWEIRHLVQPTWLIRW